MKINIIFHSVCGNTFLMAESFQQNFAKHGQEAHLFRLEDTDWTPQEKHTDENKKVFERMHQLPVATPEAMLDADMVLLGSPTYFGNVSAETKIYMDKIAVYWIQAQLAGKRFAAFTSAGNPEGGGDLCLQAMHTFAKYMGMLSVPVPTNILPGQNINALGVLHYSMGTYATQLDEKTQQWIENFCGYLAKL